MAKKKKIRQIVGEIVVETKPAAYLQCVRCGTLFGIVSGKSFDCACGHNAVKTEHELD